MSVTWGFLRHAIEFFSYLSVQSTFLCRKHFREFFLQIFVWVEEKYTIFYFGDDVVGSKHAIKTPGIQFFCRSLIHTSILSILLFRLSLISVISWCLANDRVCVRRRSWSRSPRVRCSSSWYRPYYLDTARFGRYNNVDSRPLLVDGRSLERLTGKGCFGQLPRRLVGRCGWCG